MKLNRVFVGFVVIVLVLIVLSQLLQPKTFVWNPTFLSSDRQPLGCYVFDSVMRQTCPNGYTTCRSTLYQLNHDGTKTPRSILIVTDDFSNTPLDLEQMEQLLDKGNRIMIATYNERTIKDKNKVEVQEADTVTDYIDKFNAKYHISPNIPFFKKFGADWERTYYYSDNFKNTILSDNKDNLTAISWVGKRNIFPLRRYEKIEMLWAPAYIAIPDVEENLGWEPIAIRKNDDFADKDNGYNYEEHIATGIYIHPYNYGPYYAPLAVSRKVGKGELILVSMPLMFTNYCVLNHKFNPLTMRLMSLLADRPIVRTTQYMETQNDIESKQSPMREFLKYEPLRHAWWIAAAGLLLFFIFTARRRQRIIPVISRPQNSNLEFIQMIGSLFFQKHQNRDIVLRRWTCFVDDVNRLAGIDLSDLRDSEDAASSLSRKTGLKASGINRYLAQLKHISDDNSKVDDKTMQRLIDFMNDITEKLK